VPIDPHLGFHSLQELERLFGLLGFMTLVVLPQHAIRRRVNDHCLHRSRTYVKPDEELGDVIMRLLRLRNLL
jgi:hypothetical protein